LVGALLLAHKGFRWVQLKQERPFTEHPGVHRALRTDHRALSDLLEQVRPVVEH